MSEKMIESTKEAIEQIKKKGVKGDVFAVKDRSISYSIEKGELTESSEYEDIGLGIRVIKNARVGYGYCVPGEEEKAVRNAIELSKFSEELDITLPEEEDTPNVRVFDEEVRDVIDDSRGASLTQSMINGTSSVSEDIIPTRGGLNMSIGTKSVANTNGVMLKERHSAIRGSVAASIDLGETSVQATESATDRQMDMDFHEVGVDAGEKVDSLRESSEMIEGDYPVIISQSALSQLIGFGFVPAINGEKVRKGKSVYEGRLGEEVASQELQILDDPTKDWGIGSGTFDDEGVVSSPTSIIDDGKLENFIYNLEDGVKSDKSSTSNGVRNGFKSPPETSHRNIVLCGKDESLEGLMPEKGIYVDNLLGAHTANPVNGNFSVVTNPVWLIEDGEKQGRIDGAMISGNIPEMLETIELADDHKKCFMEVGSRSLIIDTPSARLNDVTISGK